MSPYSCGSCGEPEQKCSCLFDDGDGGDWVDCWSCGGSGFTDHDCGEDTCMCLDPEDDTECEMCRGDGGWRKRLPDNEGGAMADEIDTADHVHHAPSGEDWVVAYVRGDTGWLEGDPVRGISDEPCGCDENWEE